MMSPDSDMVSHDTGAGSPDRRGPIVVHEGALRIKSRIMFCTRWKSKYVKVRADTKQLAIYDKKVSANSTGKRGECLLIQLKQVVECRADETSKKRNSFLIQKTPNAGSNRQIIFGCVNPADRDRWVHIINDVMNGTITGQSAFDEVVVSSSALTHLVKTRPKNPGRRPPGHRSRALVSSPTGEIGNFGDDADSGVGASSELLAAHSTVHKLDGDSIDEVIEQSPTSQESVERRAESNECLVDVEEDPKPKTEKVSTLQRLKRQKKSESKTSRQEKNASFFSRLGSRISRALSRSQSTEESTEQSKDIEQRTGSKKTDEHDQQIEIQGIKEEEAIEEVKLSPTRDTLHAMPTATKSGHDKVILELAAIAQNAKLVAAKAEALKSARLQGDSDSSGEESSGTGKTLSRRDSEKNIEQAAENLRTTLQNLSEAELLEIEKTDSDSPEKPEVKTKPDVPMKMKMDMSVINEMEGFFAKSNKSLKNRKENGDKAPGPESVEAKENHDHDDVKGKDENLDVKGKENGHDGSLDSKKGEEESEKKEVEKNEQNEKKSEEKDEKDGKKDEVGEDENEKEESKTDESSDMKEPESEENEKEEDRKKEEIDSNVSQESKQVKSQEDDLGKVKLNGELNSDDKTTD